MATIEKQITVIKESKKGAKLITDGEKEAWIKPSWSREDGTFTPAAYKALENGKPRETKEEFAKRMREERKKPVELAPFIEQETEKALCIKGFLRCVHTDQEIGRKIWIPKSQITRNENGGIEIPKWLYQAKLEELKDQKGSYPGTVEVYLQ